MLWTKATLSQRVALLERLGHTLDLGTVYPGQWDVITSDERVRVLSGGERAGKSYTVSLDGVSRCPWGRLFWLVGPDYYLPRKEFEYIETFLWRLKAIRSRTDVNKPKEGSWRLVTKSGQTFQTRTSADVRKLAADSVDGILMCEAGQQSFETFLKCRGRVAEAHGWLLASGTIENSYDWYSSTINEWMEDPPDRRRCFVLPTWDNVFSFPKGLEDPEIQALKEAYSPIPGYFEEKCGAVPAPPLGVIFRKFSYSAHVSESAVYNARVPVYLAVDPSEGGPSPYVVAACQFLPDPNIQRALHEGRAVLDPLDFCHVIDVLYMPSAQFEHVEAIVKSKDWWDNVAGGAIDVEEPDEFRRWTSLGVPLARQKISIAEGERRLQTFLHYEEGGRPHLQFSPSVDATALSEFQKYRSGVLALREMEERPSAAVRRRKGPEHLLKALWYLLYARYGPVRGRKTQDPVTRSAWQALKDAYHGRHRAY